MPAEPRLSLCLIVKDEAENLTRCLRSAAGVVDEIVVVDTGSADATPEVARALGALVYHEPWQNDFSLARNAALRRAGGDWVLVLDADEELAEGKELLPQLLAAPPDVEGYFLTIESPTTDLPEAQVLRHANLRLFRRRPEYQFCGAIHEQILPSILAARPGARLPVAPVVIRHHGYLAGKNAAKAARNRAILERALAARPDDPFQRYNLGVTCHQSGDYRGALEAFWPLYHRLSPATGFYPSLVRSLAITLLETGDAHQALAVAEKGCQKFPDYTDLFYLRALALKRLYRHGEALQVLEELGRLPPAPARYVSTLGVNGPLARVLLGQIREELGEPREAARCYLEALREAAPPPGALAGLVRVLRGRGLAGEKLAEALRQLLPRGVAAVWPALLRVLAEEGEGRAALALLPLADRAEEAGGNEGERLLLARCYLQAGRWREAVREALKVRPPGPAYAEALRVAFLAASLGERRRLARHCLRRLQVAGEAAAAKVLLAYALHLWGAAVAPEGVQLDRREARQVEEAWGLLARALEGGSRRHAAAARRVVSLLAGEEDALRLGHLYYRYGWAAEAADCYLKALEARQVDEAMCLAMGRICTARGLYKEAATFYQQAVELNPAPANTLLLVEARLREAAALLAEGQRYFPGSHRLAALREVVEASLDHLGRSEA